MSFRKIIFCSVFLLLCFTDINQIFWDNARFNRGGGSKWKVDRLLSINLGGGECNLDPNSEVFGTLLACYPGSGMRLLWQHAKGLTGIEVGHDLNIASEETLRTGIMRTEYPNLEGVWSWGNKMDQVILIVRNPRWALPSYYTLLTELYYTHGWKRAHKYLHRRFSFRTSARDKWMRWRDYRFDEEILLWRFFIDYWMKGGEQYWMDGDYDRSGNKPFKWLNETERKRDVLCIYMLDCYPRTILSYDRLRDPVTGAYEANKLAQALDGKLGIKNVNEESPECVWHQTEKLRPARHQPVKNKIGEGAEEFQFTNEQMLKMIQTLEEMREEYSSRMWAQNDLARQLVMYFENYIDDITAEIERLEYNALPTSDPNTNNQQSLFDWGKSIEMTGIWPKIKQTKNN